MTNETKPPARDVVAWFDHVPAQMVIAEVIDGKQTREIRLDYYQARLLIDALSSPAVAIHMLRQQDRDRITSSFLDAAQQELTEDRSR